MRLKSEGLKTSPSARGISLQYCYMLTGDENTIKPNRMVARFIEQATHQEYNSRYNRRYNPLEMTHLVINTCQILRVEYPNLTPRALDRLIWDYQQTHT
jgi:hypothetical protein